MPVVVGVSFREAARIHLLGPGALTLEEGDRVVGETVRGIELGIVRIEPHERPACSLPQPLRSVLRLATPEDWEQDRSNRSRERQAFEICAQKIERHGLPMKLLRAEYTLDRARVVFFFAADGRVDFRELVKDLAATLRTRIELHQVGSRDAAKLLGGLGRCGRELCCASWLPGFEPVSMRMAKDQDLTLNPAKFSGQCAKLMCCLRFEVDTYREARQTLPQPGSTVLAPGGQAVVAEVNVPSATARVRYEETGAQDVVPISALRWRANGERACPNGNGCPGC